MEKLSGKDLRLTAAKVRLLAVDAVYTAASGHPGGSLSCADILTALYFNEMNVDPAQPKWSGRDRFVLSKGHCSPALYAVLALRGFFPAEELKLFRSIKAHFSGHPDMKNVPGVDMSTGSLGQGLSTPWAWPWPPLSAARATAATPSAATASWPRGRSGRPLWPPPSGIWTTCVCLWM